MEEGKDRSKRRVREEGGKRKKRRIGARGGWGKEGRGGRTGRSPGNATELGGKTGKDEKDEVRGEKKKEWTKAQGR